VFVHGCFWHGHDCTKGVRKPKTNRDYWIPKIRRNQQRDTEHVVNLRSAGWNILVIWECEISDKNFLTRKLQQFLIQGDTAR
jgi:DNA mismatch endonuclease (patch repair protein)